MEKPGEFSRTGGEDARGGKVQCGQGMGPHFLDATETRRGSGPRGVCLHWGQDLG